VADTIEVLLVGFDPATVPGVDAALVEHAIELGRARLDEAGFVADECLLGFDDPDAEAEVARAVTAKPYACVVVGGGIRKPESLLERFERVVNLVHRLAPQAAIAFNSNPTDSADAAARALRSAAGA
jgi:hypothetical protein